MNGLYQAMGRMVRTLGRPLAEDEADAIEAILEAARAWAEDRLDLFDAARVGPITPPSGGPPNVAYGRTLALMYTPKDDPRRHQLVRLCNELDKRKKVITEQGMAFDREDIARSNEAIAICRRNGSLPPPVWVRHDKEPL